MEIPWSELTPLALPHGAEPAAPLEGGMSIVLRGTWRPARAGAPARAVAVKVLKAGILAGASLEGALEMLQREAAAMRAASDSGMNEYVVQLYGLARGKAPSAWVAALGPHAGACLTHEGGRSNGSGGVGGSPGGAGSPGGGGDGGGGHCFALVMRWEEGGSLHDLLHAPTRAWGAGTAERLLLCAQIASGLGALHCCSSGMLIHGDICAYIMCC